MPNLALQQLLERTDVDAAPIVDDARAVDTSATVYKLRGESRVFPQCFLALLTFHRRTGILHRSRQQLVELDEVVNRIILLTALNLHSVAFFDMHFLHRTTAGRLEGYNNFSEGEYALFYEGYSKYLLVAGPGLLPQPRSSRDSQPSANAPSALPKRSPGVVDGSGVRALPFEGSGLDV